MGDHIRVRDTAELPATYREHRAVNLKDKKFTVAVQGIFLVVALAALGVALLRLLPLDTSWSSVLTIPVTLVACIIYMAAHEATHGVLLHMLTKVKPFYAVRFPFLTTGNHAYLTRRSAVIVALAPAVIWGIILIAALSAAPQDYRLTVYILLALNFAGSAGDYVEVYVVTRQQPDALVQDDGNKVRVFIPRDGR